MLRYHRPAAARFLAAALLCVLCSPGGARAGATVETSLGVEPAAARVGEAIVVQVMLDVPAPFHLYSMTRIPEGPLPLAIAAESRGLDPLGEWHGPRPAVALDTNFGKAVELHTGKVVYTRAFTVRGAPGERAIKAVVRGQICDEESCVPFRKELLATIAIEPGATRAERAAAPRLAGEPFPADRPPPKAEAADRGGGSPKDGSLLGFLVLAFVAGLGALVTPCVFPMIPITVSFFSRFAKVSTRRAALMAGLYSASIVVTYTALGLAVSAVFGAVGMQKLSASPAFNLFLVALLVAFALNLFGLFEIQLPNALVSRSSRKEQELTADAEGPLLSQAAGVFFMALTFTMVSFTCTAGFIGMVLAEASTGHWFYPAVGMLVFSSAFAVPFFFLALFPAGANALAGKAGDWMVAVKVVLGFLLVLGAFKFLSNVDLVLGWHFLSRPMVLSIWVGVFLAAGLFLLRVFNLPHSDADNRVVGPLRMVAALTMFAMAAYSATGIGSTKSMGGWLDGWLPHATEDSAAASEAAGRLPWIENDIPRGMAEAKAQGLPLFIDFSGYTCTNCRYMEGSVFPRAEVRQRLARFARVQAVTDAAGAASERQQRFQLERFQTVALPFYAVIDPNDDSTIATFAGMTNDAGEFTAFLDRALAAFAARRPEAAPTPPPAPESPVAPAPSASAAAVELAAAGPLVDFEFPGLFDGKKVKLSSLRGGFVFVNFWASWCAPCKKELKEDFLPALAGAPEVRLVTVAFDGEDTQEVARQIAIDSGLRDRITLQGGDDITAAGLDVAFAATESLPHSYLIHPDGHIAWLRHGAVDRDLLTRLFAQAKGGKGNAP